jgi:hypothetical protein
MPCPNGKVSVRGYTTKKGRTVKPHTRNCPAGKGKKGNYSAYKRKGKKKPVNMGIWV